MSKKLLKKIIPPPEKIKKYPGLRLIAKHLNNRNLWHLNKRSAAKAVAIGLFCSFQPIPFQMLLAAILAIGLQANLSLALVAVWVVNPITIAPIFYLSFKVGSFILNTSEFNFKSGFSIDAIYTNFKLIWQPLWVGSLICGTVCALIGYYLTKIIWNILIFLKLKKRKTRKSKIR